MLSLGGLAPACGGGDDAATGGEQLPEFCSRPVEALPEPPANRPGYTIDAAVAPDLRTVAGARRRDLYPRP